MNPLRINPLNVWRLIVAWWRRWDAQRKAARARRKLHEDMAYTVELILTAPEAEIDHAVADLERQIAAVRADTE